IPVPYRPDSLAVGYLLSRAVSWSVDVSNIDLPGTRLVRLVRHPVPVRGQLSAAFTERTVQQRLRRACRSCGTRLHREPPDIPLCPGIQHLEQNEAAIGRPVVRTLNQLRFGQTFLAPDAHCRCS